MSCANPALWEEFKCSLGYLFEQSQTGGVIVRGTQGTGGATANRPASQPTTTTETEVEPENHDDCHEFTETITETVAGKSVTQRAFNFKASGIPLMTAGFYKVWSREGSKMAGTMGVRPELVANNQGTDAYAHSAFLLGAAADFSPVILPFIGIDAYEAASGRPESVTELKDDFAGVLVAGALGYGVVTGDATTTKRLVNTIVCGSK
jgi:hypothetical protein